MEEIKEPKGSIKPPVEETPPDTPLAEKSVEERRKEKIRQAAEEAYEEFIKKDLEQKFGRLTKGTTLTPEEAQFFKQKFINDRETIINEVSDSIVDGIEKGRRVFDSQKIREGVHDLIWAKMLDPVYEKQRVSGEKVDLFGPSVHPATGENDTTSLKAISFHAIQKADNYDQLGPELKTKKSRDERIKKLARELIDQFTVHGSWRDGAWHLHSDLDGQSCLMLFEMAGFKVTPENVEYVEKGETTKKDSSWVADTSGKHGFVVEGFGKILITDHHGEESTRESSATSLLFKGLREFGFFDRMGKKEMNALEQYVDFVTKEDNKEFSKEESQKIYEHYDSNLAGLKRYLPEKDLYRIFLDHCKEGEKFDSYFALDDEYLQKLKFPNFKGRPVDYKKVKGWLNKSKAESISAIREIRKGGMVVFTGGGNFGNVLIDTGKYNANGRHVRKVGWGWDAARANKYGAYIVWDPERHYFQIFADKELDFDLGQGKNVRGRYILFSSNEKDPLTVSLRDILAALLRDSNFQLKPELQKALDDDKIKQERDRVEAIAEKERERMVQKIARAIFSNRKSKDSKIAARKPEKADIEKATDLLRIHEEQEKLKDTFNENQFKEYVHLKEALRRVYADLAGVDFSGTVSKEEQKLIVEDMNEIIENDFIQAGIFLEDQRKELKRLLLEAMELEFAKSNLKINF